MKQGGHRISEEIIRRRFARGISNLLEFYLALADEVYLYDGSQLPPALMWQSIEGHETVVDQMKWLAMKLPESKYT